jgi:hypothetical protein
MSQANDDDSKADLPPVAPDGGPARECFTVLADGSVTDIGLHPEITEAEAAAHKRARAEILQARAARQQQEGSNVDTEGRPQGEAGGKT